MLRLGTKYQIECLRDDAVRRLGACFPSQLDTFTTLYTSELFKKGLVLRYPHDVIVLKQNHVVAVVELAQTFDLHHLLPSALYMCAQLSIDMKLNGYRDRDGRNWVLSKSTLKRCLAGEAKLRLETREQEKFVMLGESSPDCPRSSSCERRLASTRRHRLRAMQETPNALSGSKWIEDIGLCEMCCTYFVQKHVGHQLKVWKNLAKYFELGDMEWPVSSQDGGAA
ncbi:hypothetical protein EIP91_010531 [Steccherinum ochraceum]|uniref:Uncharacterized protein n=1 Tax=Steccherinum ochraceum TaxID=92696 RepID=A0A4R0R329_9APHY|nr:hypothetical protein EIP91_010531 [Steccherinum ochraceum]